MDNQISIADIKNIIFRRKKILLGIFISIVIVSVLVAIVLPPIYRSKVGIVIEEQQIPESYVQSTISSYVEERIQVITKQVMSRSKLLGIIKKYNLYSDHETEYTEEEKILKMRANIELQTETANVGVGKNITIGFTLSYSGKNPERLQPVANELAYLFLEEEQRSKEKSASVTTEFLQQELDSFKAHIATLEDKIGEFKKEHVGELPQNYAGNIQALDRMENSYQDIEREIRSLNERKLYLKAQIANIEPLTPVVMDGNNMMMNPAERLKRLRLELLSSRTVYSDKHPDIIKLQREIKELEAQVGDQNNSVEKIKKYKDLQGKLAAMRGRLGDKHPDVIALEKEYNALSKEVDNLITLQVVSTIEDSKPDNPVYISLMTQIVTIDSQIEGYKEKLEQISRSIELYRKRIENGPVIETEYNKLTRDLDTTKSRYNDLLAKYMQAKVAQGMESSQRGERFAISEPADYPEKPYKPNRKLILVLGLLFAIGASTGVVALMEAIDSSMKSAKDINNYTGLPVFSVFPMIQTEEEKRKAKMKRYAYGLAFVVLMCISVAIVDRAVMPIDIIWSKTLNRLVEIGVPLDTLTESGIK